MTRAAHPAEPVTPSQAKETKRTVWSGVLAGIGLAAFVDETVFHQLLHWHHFYDKSTVAVGLVSDGLLHAGGFTSMVMLKLITKGMSNAEIGHQLVLSKRTVDHHVSAILRKLDVDSRALAARKAWDLQILRSK